MSCWREAALTLAACLLPLAPASGDERRLTADGRIKSDPVFTDRSGKELVYAVQESPNLIRLVRLRLADGTVTPIDPAETKTRFEPAFSPDGRYFAFVQSKGNLSLGMVIRDTKTGKEAELKPAGGFSGPRRPAIAPSGRVLYSFAEKGRQKILSVDLNAGDSRVVIDSPGINNAPDVSADGKRVAFSSSREGNFEVYVAGIDGGGVRRLTSHPRQDIRPRFSPDGKRIAFTSNRDGNYEIYVIGADGAGLVRVTNNPERDDYPVWHPDGRRLVIVSERKGKQDLYLLDVP